jgi:hypothetical protein
MKKKYDEFTTTEGLTVGIKPVSQVLINLVGARVEKEWRARGEPVDAPTYTTTTAAGTEEVLAWTKEMLEAMDAATRAEWDRHVKTVDGMNREIRTEQARVWVLQGVVLPEGVGPEGDPAWARMMKAVKVEVPEDETERLLLYYDTAIFKTPADMMGVTQAVMMISADGVAQEELDAIENLFRRAMEGPATKRTGAADQGAVVDEPAVPGSGDGEGVDESA